MVDEKLREARGWAWECRGDKREGRETQTGSGREKEEEEEGEEEEDEFIDETPLAVGNQ